ncbi:DUF3138 family protein [Burkholderia pyrrocinia]|uniref:DUF3138 family protein n=1 Tax=Burkholderia pyrrocinia TaxID=60550 RepID=UPI00158AC0EB|nr:DUF3138 family protein [Burkholderia pyrrocinia]
MKKKYLCALIAGALPGLAAANSSADQIRALQQQLAVLQRQMSAMQSQLAAKPAAAPAASNAAPAATGTVAPDPSAPGYGQARAALTNDDVTEIRQQVANQQLKVDSLTDAARTGPIAGLSVTGYLDPTYLYNRGAGTSSFQFANHENAYTYYNSTFGDVFLDIKKTFGVGPTAPSAEITLMPNRGAGLSMMTGSGASGLDIVNTAVVTVPLSGTTAFVGGLVLGFGGYEYQQSSQMLTLTHNLLYDFSDPGSSIGAGINYQSADGHWAWKFFVGNEQFRSAGAVTQTGVNALGDPITTSNKVPTFTARVDYLRGSALDIGGSINIGRQTLPSAIDPATGNVRYGVGGNAPSAYGAFFFGEVDATYTLADAQYNAEIDYGQQQHGAFNGGLAQWFGLSLLAHRKFNVPVVGRMGATLRYDLLVNRKNGGGGSSIGLNGNGMDPNNGFGIDADCLAMSKANGGVGFECKGATRQAAAFDLLFYPTQQVTVKVEYRHDWASNKVFLRHDGSYAKSNDLLATQLIYAF